MKYLAITVMAAILSGCAAGVVTSTPYTVIIEGVNGFNREQAQRDADTECRKHGRWAVQKTEIQYGFITFECVGD